MAKHLYLLTTALLLGSGFATAAFGQQRPPISPTNPSMRSQVYETDKETLYSTYFEYRNMPDPEHQKLAYDIGREYLRRFGGENDADVKEVKRFVSEYEKGKGEYQISLAYGEKKYLKVFEMGRATLQKDPENFFVLGMLTEAGYDNAIGGDASLNAETLEHARKAIQLLEEGKIKRVAPFRSLEIARGFLNLALGTFLKDQAPVEAAVAFLKSAKSDSPFHTDPIVYHRLGAAVLKGEFAQLSGEYNKKYGNQAPSAEQQAMLERVLAVGNRAIDAYARAVALSTKPEQAETKTKILAQLTALYKSFHAGSEDGLNELIAGVLAKPIP